MVPARKRFDPPDLSRSKVNLRLEMGLKLKSSDPRFELVRQGMMTLRRVAHPLFKCTRDAFPVPLGFIQRHVGVAKESVHVVGTISSEGKPDADANTAVIIATTA